MSDLVALIRENQQLFEWLGIASMVMFVATIVVFPLVIVSLPEDYFVREDRDRTHRRRSHPLIWLTLMVAKNTLGFALVGAGVAMLVLPGQGLLTILLGITLLNFPGKYRLERGLVRRRSVARTLNRIRRKAGRAELILPVDPRQDDSA